jgi:hypothetical protein
MTALTLVGSFIPAGIHIDLAIVLPAPLPQLQYVQFSGIRQINGIEQFHWPKGMVLSYFCVVTFSSHLFSQTGRHLRQANASFLQLFACIVECLPDRPSTSTTFWSACLTYSMLRLTMKS